MKLDSFHWFLIIFCVFCFSYSSSKTYKMLTIIHEDKSTIDSLIIMEKHGVNPPLKKIIIFLEKGTLD